MAKKNNEAFCVIDHANKQADRERTNPNRKKLRSMRVWGGVAKDIVDAIRESRKSTAESELPAMQDGRYNRLEK